MCEGVHISGMFQRYFTVWWGRGGGIAAPAEIPFLGLAEPRLCQTQKKSISWRACALQTSRDCKTETAGFETCLRQGFAWRRSTLQLGRCGGLKSPPHLPKV